MPTKPARPSPAPGSSTTQTPPAASSPRSPMATTAGDPSYGILMKMLTRRGSSTSQKEELQALKALAERQA